MFVPKLFTSLKNYSLKLFLSDLSAGTIVGIVALPLAIAFAIASGVSPEKGLFTAIIGGFIISFLGGSRVQIGGPTGAFVIIVYSIIQKHGIDGLIIATMMAGIILILMGVIKLGKFIKYIPYPIIVGFTSGIAVTIFSSQIKDLLGITSGPVPAEFIEKWYFYLENLTKVNPIAIIICVSSLVFLFIWPKINKKIPGSLIVIIAGTLIVWFFKLNVMTIHSQFGSIPTGLPVPKFPNVNLALIRDLIQPAVTIAMLAAIESLLSAVVADGMTGFKHRANMELIAQGIANICSPLFGGIPVTGAIARTATNVKNGGKTPIAGIIHAVVLLLIMLLFGKLAEMIPLPVLAAILIFVSYNMAEIDAIKVIFTKAAYGDIIALVVTFILTVLVDLTVAIEVGMILAAFIFMKRMSDVSSVKSIREEMEVDSDDDEEETDEHLTIPNKIEIFEINGPFFFGSVDKFHYTIDVDKKKPEIIIIRMKSVPFMDIGGLRAFEELIMKCKKNKIKLLITEIQDQPKKFIRKSGLELKIGKENIYADINDAVMEHCD